MILNLTLQGKGAYLYSHTGKRYVDCVNNVAHVGHSHPAVCDAVAVRAVAQALTSQRQMAILNTNTRYLHDTILEVFLP